MTDTPLTAAELAQFTGSEFYYRQAVIQGVQYVCTDGVKFLSERAGAYWLIDEILFAQRAPQIAKNLMLRREFQVWTLTVEDDRSAWLSCEDGDGYRALTKRIPYTDFPLPDITLYLVEGVLMLPSEY